MIIFFFFRKKKRKALFCFAEDYEIPNFREAEPRGLGLAPEKQVLRGQKPSAKRNHGVLGWPQKNGAMREEVE
jgi:hypothetical protein